MAYLLPGLQWMVAIVFATAVGSKIARPRYAEFVTATGRLLPARLGRWQAPVAAIVAGTELAIIPLVLLPATTPVAFAATLVLNTGFGIAIAAAMRKGQRAPCRCFGSGAPLGLAHLVRNAALVVVGGVGLAVSVVPHHPLRPASVVVAAVAGGVAAVLLIRLDDLVALLGPMSTVSPNEPQPEV